MAGYWDSPPELEGSILDLQPQTKLMEDLRHLCSRKALDSHALECLKAYSSKRSLLPFNLAGGPALLRAVNKPNRFAAPLAPLLQRYFTSSQQSSVEEIAERAYVSSDEVTEYDRILESLLKERISARHGTSVEYLHPQRTGEETLERTIASVAKSGKRYGQLQLIQGAVGSGKSLFMVRYKQKLQSPASREKTKWATIDFNTAPVSLSGAEHWLCREFIESFQNENPEIDFSSIAVLRGIYSRKIQMRKALYSQLEESSPQQADARKVEDILQWQDNVEETTKGVAEYVVGINKSLVVVMDNVDRLDLGNQLSAFQLTLWFMQLTRAFVIL